MKKFIIIILVTLAIGISIFAFMVFRDQAFISDFNEIDVNVDLDNGQYEEDNSEMLEEGQKIYDKYVNKMQEQEESKPSTPREQQIAEIDKEYEKTGELPFIYLMDGWQDIFNILCRKNQNWEPLKQEIKEIDLKEYDVEELKELANNQESPKIDVSRYITDNLKEKYNENDSIIPDLLYEDITSIYFDYITNELRVDYIQLGNTCFAKYLVDIRVEDNMHKVNDIFLQFDSSNISYPYCDLYDYMPILALVSEHYNPIDVTKLYEDYIPEDKVYAKYKFSEETIENGIKDKDICPNLDSDVNIIDWNLDDITDNSYTLKFKVKEEGKYYNYSYKYVPKFGENHSFLDFDVYFNKKLVTSNNLEKE